MNMNMDHGSPAVPWLDQPVMLHSSRADKCTLSPKDCAYRSGYWRYWYINTIPSNFSLLGKERSVIAVFMLIHIFGRISSSKARSSSPLRRTVASFRYLSYKGFRVGRWSTPSLGVILLLAAGAIFYFALTLGPKPYYWPNTQTKSFGSSPPIATRTGWLALGLLPFTLYVSSAAFQS